MDYLAHLAVIQHTSAEYLGLVEDHLRGEVNRRLFIWSLLCFESWLRTFTP